MTPVLENIFVDAFGKNFQQNSPHTRTKFI